MSSNYDLIVIGAGPGGEVGAIRAAQLGLKVALIDKRSDLGGTCLNVGCIPTKALLYAAKTWDKLQHLEEIGLQVSNPSFDWPAVLNRKDKIVEQMRKGLKFLMKKNKVDVYCGTGSLKSANEVIVIDAQGQSQSLVTKNVLLATGSKVKDLPFAKPNGKTIQSSDHILGIASIPKTLCVVGGGVVGMEFASLFGRMGSKVTVVEYAPQILPFEDHEVVKEAARAFAKQNITIETGSKLTAVLDKGTFATVSVEGKKDRDFDVVLMSVGRQPVTEGLNLEALGIKTTQHGHVVVNEHFQTSVPNVYAIGDILDTPALAHTASAEAGHAVEYMANHHPQPINYSANPSAIYTYPEIAHIGLTENEAKAKGIVYETVKFPFSALAKANIEQSTVGFVKLIYDKAYREVLGAHIIGATATELIAELALAKVLESTIDEIAATIHPHPTISETVMEAAHMALGGAIHM